MFTSFFFLVDIQTSGELMNLWGPLRIRWRAGNSATNICPRSHKTHNIEHWEKQLDSSLFFRIQKKCIKYAQNRKNVITYCITWNIHFLVRPWWNYFLFSKRALKLSCAMRFICLESGRFVIKCPYARKFKVLQNYKIPSLVDFYSLYQLLHSQLYRNGLKLWISNVKSVLINEGESNRKLLKLFAGKNLWMTLKSFTRWFETKGLTRWVENICVCGR